jgi:protease-4
MSEVYSEKSPSSVERTVQIILVYGAIIALALVGAYYLAQALIPSPKIGIIYIEGPIGSISAEILSREIDYVTKSGDIQGVVLEVNSPGGGASSGHDMYFQIRNLRDKMPVVASVDVLAASAAYQIAIAANEIYAKPASFIGSIGVFMAQSSPEVLSEQIITTGPFKATAFSVTSQVQKLDLLLDDFRNSVVAERSLAPNPLTLNPGEVATGEIWVGIEAKEYGLIDKLGSRADAIEAVAEMAGLKNYEIVDVRTEYLASLADVELSTALQRYEELDAGVEIDLASEEARWPSFYQLYLPLE